MHGLKSHVHSRGNGASAVDSVVVCEVVFYTGADIDHEAGALGFAERCDGVAQPVDSQSFGRFVGNFQRNVHRCAEDDGFRYELFEPARVFIGLYRSNNCGQLLVLLKEGFEGGKLVLGKAPNFFQISVMKDGGLDPGVSGIDNKRTVFRIHVQQRYTAF